MANQSKLPDPINDMVTITKGLTTRELYAGMAMQGLLSRISPNDLDIEVRNAVVIRSRQLADDLIIELGGS